MATIDHLRVREDTRERLLAGLPVTERRMALAGVSTAVLGGTTCFVATGGCAAIEVRCHHTMPIDRTAMHPSTAAM